MIFKGKLRTFILIVLLGLLTGGIHVGLFIEINQIIGGLVKTGNAPVQLFVIALVLLLVYLALNRILSKKMIDVSQSVIHDFRIRLMKAVAKLSYEELVIRKELLNSAITKDTVALSQAALASVYLITSMVTVTGCLVYLSFLSFKMIAIILTVILLGLCVYIPGSRKSSKNLRQARESEDELFHHVSEVIDGFREIKINPEKGNDLIEGPLYTASNDNYQYASKGLSGYFNHSLTGQLLFYLAMLVLLFLGTTWFNMPVAMLVNCTFVVLYLAGPLESVVVLLPGLGAGNIAAGRLQELMQSAMKDKQVLSPVSDQPFEKLELQEISFEYTFEKHNIKSRFRLGPVDFVLKKGELAFIHGGNGSGKTTFFHLVLGLLKPDLGRIRLNGKIVPENETVNRLFAPVFSDFHLFDKLYGLTDIDVGKANYYLEMFELHEKVKFENDHFSLLKLSTGQRKRLALIAMLLEKKPLLFLDEWAADQDPFFRRKFYEVILPLLKEEGFTILAITHDDRYYHVADHLYKMESGQLLKIDCFNTSIP